MQNIFREFAWRMLCSIEIILNKIHETLFFHQSATYWGHWSWPSRDSSNLIYVITWKARGCGAQFVGDTTQTLKGRFRSHSFKIRNNCRRWQYKNFVYDHFIKYNSPWATNNPCSPPGGIFEGMIFWKLMKNATKWAMFALWPLGRLGFLG